MTLLALVQAGAVMRMQELRDRTKQIALRVVRLCSSLPATMVAQTLGRQLLRSGTSVAANLREATRARSHAEFVSKLGIVEQELDETLLWLELLVDSEIMPADRLAPLADEADQLLRIVVAAIKSAKKNK